MNSLDSAGLLSDLNQMVHGRGCRVGGVRDSLNAGTKGAVDQRTTPKAQEP